MNAVIYARYSSDSQREESIEGQIRECTEYAQRNNITILNTYIVNVKPEASRQRSQALLQFSFRWTSSEVARSLKNSRLYQSFS